MSFKQRLIYLCVLFYQKHSRNSFIDGLAECMSAGQYLILRSLQTFRSRHLSLATRHLRLGTQSNLHALQTNHRTYHRRRNRPFQGDSCSSTHSTQKINSGRNMGYTCMKIHEHPSEDKIFLAHKTIPSQPLTLSSTETNMTLELLDIWQLEHVELAQ